MIANRRTASTQNPGRELCETSSSVVPLSLTVYNSLPSCRTGSAAHLRARIRRRHHQLGAAGQLLCPTLPGDHLLPPWLSAFRRAQGTWSILAGTAGRRYAGVVNALGSRAGVHCRTVDGGVHRAPFRRRPPGDVPGIGRGIHRHRSHRPGAPGGVEAKRPAIAVRGAFAGSPTSTPAGRREYSSSVRTRWDGRSSGPAWQRTRPWGRL